MAANHPAYLYWNDRLVPWQEATVHVSAIAWTGLGAVFEGIRGYWNAGQEQLHIFRLDDHLDRLQDSAKLVRLPLSRSTGQLSDVIVDLVRQNGCREDTYIFPLVFPGDPDVRRVNPGELEPDLTITTRPMPSHLGSDLAQHARVSTWTRISDTVMPPRVKNISNYRNGQLAMHEVKQDGYDLALMLNPQSKVAEAPGACVALISKGQFITPDLTSGILASITRDTVMTLAREDLGLEVVERTVDRTELYTADEVFTMGTAAEITPVISVDRYTVGSGEIGPVTRELQRRYEDILRGREDRYGQWRTTVSLSIASVTSAAPMG